MSRKIFLTAMVTMILGVSVASAALYDSSKHFYHFYHFVVRVDAEGNPYLVRYGFNMRDRSGNPVAVDNLSVRVTESGGTPATYGVSYFSYQESFPLENGTLAFVNQMYYRINLPYNGLRNYKVELLDHNNKPIVTHNSVTIPGRDDINSYDGFDINSLSYKKVAGGTEFSWNPLASKNHDVYRIFITNYNGPPYEILRDLTYNQSSILIDDALLAVKDNWDVEFNVRDNNPNSGDDNPIWLRQYSGAKTIDIDPIEVGSVSGHVTNVADGSPISDVRVLIFKECGGDSIIETYTDNNGYYNFESLPVGKVYVRSSSETSAYGLEEYVDEWYDAGLGTYECKDAKAVNVSSGQNMAGIDFSLLKLCTGTNFMSGITIPIGEGDGKSLERGLVGDPIIAESGERLEVHFVGYLNPHFELRYFQPGSSDGYRVGQCHFKCGINEAYYWAYDDDKDKMPDCFIRTKWINEDGAGDDNLNNLADIHHYIFDPGKQKLSHRILKYKYNCKPATDCKANVLCKPKYPETPVEDDYVDPPLGSVTEAFFDSLLANLDNYPPEEIRMMESSIIFCDIDFDGDCDNEDLHKTGKAIGTCIGDANYIAGADFDLDGCVTGDDRKQIFPEYKNPIVGPLLNLLLTESNL